MSLPYYYYKMNIPLILFVLVPFIIFQTYNIIHYVITVIYLFIVQIKNKNKNKIKSRKIKIDKDKILEFKYIIILQLRQGLE